ncbi:MAG: diaminopimelate decarboxylase [Clostridiales Family XIII bacterium]|jgi:diaminopimelate decarboxylase|nr:diaminopimelate decarboxylase [Clostridiales Family XIII bacterium]
MGVFETRDNKLYMDGVDLTALAAEFGTPLYVLSRAAIERNIDEVKRSFTDKYAGTEAAYASKAFLSIAMAQLIGAAGLCLDVVSGGELYTALRAGFPPERIIFHGSNKTPQEIEAAALAGDIRITVDAGGEVDMIERVCDKIESTGLTVPWGKDRQGAPVRVLFRINPRVDIHGHEYMATGKADSKFGFSIDEDVIYPAIGRAADAKHVTPVGIHFHVGSQVFDNKAHLAALEEALKIMKGAKDRLGIELTELNIGGGYGIRYADGDVRRPYSYFVDPVMARVNEYCAENGLAAPKVIIEPGRSIVGDAGVTLYTVGSIREIAGVRKFVSVDGGMTDNIRPALYGAKYEAVVANKAGEPADECVTVVGKCCESGDRLIEDATLACAGAGDILAVFTTGAYGYSMASNYNKLPIPAVALIDEGTAKLIVRRQTYDDLIARDLPL